ncbi:MAG TPA: phosphoenolpyruvate synthase [Nanoarchaeota archaeon]|nr:phosphoenolpyruvate synthase [Nanoarchaeota archaeon]
MATYTSWFKQIHKDDVDIAGGKGANLGEMWNNGFPVPNGFILLAQAYRDFLKENNLDKKIYSKLEGINYEDTAHLEKTAKEIQGWISSAKISEDMKEEIEAAYSMFDTVPEIHKNKIAERLLLAGRDPPFVAVRSSATAEDLPQASFAGQQASFLNIKGKAKLIQAVKDCWASLYTGRAIYYRQKNNFPHEKVALCVVVQKQVNSEKSGIMFSINPATNNEKEIVIEAIYGLGEAVVSGSVSPNTYIIDKDFEKIIDTDTPKQDFLITRDAYGNNIQKKLNDKQNSTQVLNEKEISVLVKLAKKSENHYKFPQDMEWAIEGGRVYMVQTRPVTTLHKTESPIKEEAQAGEAILHGLGASAGIASGKVKLVYNISDLDKVEKGDILVAQMTNPDYVPAMQRAVAIVTDAGGITSHAAIVSREMGIPAIVGTKEATKLLKDGDVITVDGHAGKVFRGEIRIEVPKEEDVVVSHAVVSSSPSEETKEQPTTNNQERATRMSIKVNVELPMSAKRASATGADGIGLLRLEGIIASGKIHPGKYLRDRRLDEYEKLIYDGVKEIVSEFEGKPVWVRTSDIRTDEFTELEGGGDEPKEANPMIGWHGIRRSLDCPDLLKAEFSAIKKLYDEGFTKIGIMLPFIISVDEVRQAKQILSEVWFGDGTSAALPIEFGVMVETPAAVLIIEYLCKEGIDFISFGTNDLTQTILGVDRGNENIAKLYSEKHPAVLRAIEHVIKICRMQNVKTSVCGQAGSDPEMAEMLFKFGIDSISANIDAVGKIRKKILELEAGQL